MRCLEFKSYGIATTQPIDLFRTALIQSKRKITSQRWAQKCVCLSIQAMATRYIFDGFVIEPSK